MIKKMGYISILLIFFVISGIVLLLQKDNISEAYYHRWSFENVYGTPNDIVGANMTVIGRKRNLSGSTNQEKTRSVSQNENWKNIGEITWEFNNINNGDKICVVEYINNYYTNGSNKLQAGYIGIWCEGAQSSIYKKMSNTNQCIEYINNRGKTANERFKITLYYDVYFTLNKNGGTGGSNNLVYSTYEQKVTTALSLPTREGYKFNGYFTSSTGGTQVVNSSGNFVWSRDDCYPTTLYAQWTINSYTLTMNANGGSISSNINWTGSGSSVKKIVKYDSQYGTLPTSSNISRLGYTFNGWWTTSTSGNEVTSLTIMGAGNRTIYAHWIANGYTLTADANGGTISSTSGWTINGDKAIKTVKYNNSYGTLPTPIREGYTFMGWYTQPSGGSKVSSSTKMDSTSGTTIYAQWSANVYHIVLRGNDDEQQYYENMLNDPSFEKREWEIYQGEGIFVENDETYVHTGNTSLAMLAINDLNNDNIIKTIEEYQLDENHVYYISVYGIKLVETENTIINCLWPDLFSEEIVIENVNEWSKYSWVLDKGLFSSGYYPLMFLCNTNGEVNGIVLDDALIVDLTLLFGEGNEPDKEWCDEFLEEFKEPSIEVFYGSPLPKITPPNSKVGYTFEGYFDVNEDAGGVKYYNSDGSSARNWDKAEDGILYERWTANKYSIVFDKNGGSGSMSNQSMTYDKASNLTTNTYTRQGYYFVGWSKTKLGVQSTIPTSDIYKDEESVKNLVASGSITLYAVWLDTWANHVTTPTGSGSSTSPYIIDSAEDLAWMINNHGSVLKYFKQTKAINLSKYNWYPIGTSDKPFKGVYDGQGYEITNLNILEITNASGNKIQSDIGLFGYTSGGEITGIYIKNATIYGKDNVGLIVSNATSTKINSNIIESSTINASGNYGAVAGKISGGEIKYNLVYVTTNGGTSTSSLYTGSTTLSTNLVENNGTRSKVGTEDLTGWGKVFNRLLPSAISWGAKVTPATLSDLTNWVDKKID